MGRLSSRALWAAKLQGGQQPQVEVAAGLQRAARAAFRGVVVGVDPSLRGTGLAALDFRRTARGEYLGSETIRPPKTATLPECLGLITNRLAAFLQRFTVDALAIEETIYVQNFRTAQILGAARGAIIGHAAYCGLTVYEYAPLRVKQSVAGYGRASKEQISGQISSLLGLSAQLPWDESDAAAVAYCHALTLGRLPV